MLQSFLELANVFIAFVVKQGTLSMIVTILKFASILGSISPEHLAHTMRLLTLVYCSEVSGFIKLDKSFLLIYLLLLFFIRVVQCLTPSGTGIILVLNYHFLIVIL